MPGPFGRVSAPPPHFPVGGPVPAEDFVGGGTNIRRIGGRRWDGNHVLPAGPRRIGRPSIILEVLRRLHRRGALTAYVDCLGATDVRGLGERLVDALLENVSGAERSFEHAKAIAAGVRPSVKVKYEHVEIALDLAREKNDQRFFDGALDLPRTLAARTGKRVIVVFDEFQAAGRLGPRVFDVMRSRFQAQRGVAYAFLGSEEGILEQLFSEKGRAFYRFAVPIDLADAGGHRFGIAHDAVLYAAESGIPRPEVLRALEALRARGLVTRLGRGKYDFVEPMFGEYVRRLDEGAAGIVPR